MKRLAKLLCDATGLKVFKADRVPVFTNIYYAISQEYKCDKAHIQVVQGSWRINTGGEYKVSVYTPTLKSEKAYHLNVPLIKGIQAKIVDALNDEFGSEWTFSNSEHHLWNPLSRSSVYIQIPNFK